MKFSRILLLPLFSGVFFTTLAHAEPTAEDRTLARSLFEEGRTLMKDGKFADACPKLVESERLEPGIGTLFNLGDCFEHVGKVASAWSAFSEAADLAKRAGQSDREQVARDRASALSPRLSHVSIHLAAPAPQGLAISLDGKTLSAAVLDTDIAVDSGEHKIGALAPGKKSTEQVAQIPDGVRQVVTVAALEDAPVEVTPPPPPPKDANPPPPVVHDGSWPWQKKAAIVAGAAGLVGLGIGAGFGLNANSEWNNAKSSCAGGTCTPAGFNSWSDARSSGNVSTGFFTAGIVLAAAAVVLFVISPKENEVAPVAQKVTAGLPFSIGSIGSIGPLGGTF